ncbi:unnamed protein product [Rangifer tarandus platyrhynchus]|uniref:Uncharacterized protein n=2 Tax=Rangifer tarandus platyrhynchus TaxID=3082113 RepID=A0ACB0E5C2_RANTA|nr:unnamed protein product [Rangifer tarandus platyrhynchus]CAI9695735.1 unnamed protein product [Rangifer tarandus platyrhynchus]
MAPPSPAPAVCVQGTFIENALVIWGLEGSQLPVMPTAVCQHRPGGPGLKHGGAVLTSASEGFAGSYASGFVRQTAYVGAPAPGSDSSRRCEVKGEKRKGEGETVTVGGGPARGVKHFCSLLTRRDGGPRLRQVLPRVEGAVAWGSQPQPWAPGWPQRSARADPDRQRRGVPRPGCGALTRQRPDLRRGIKAARGSPGVCEVFLERRSGVAKTNSRPAARLRSSLPAAASSAPTVPDTHTHSHTHTHTRHPGRAGAASERRRAGLEVGVLPHSPPPKRRPHPPAPGSPAPSLSLLRK